MKPFETFTGLVAVLDRTNVDTDQMIPKQFCKLIERTGFGPRLFFDWRYKADGTPNPEFPLNFPRFQGASILLAGANFASGSSREHAVWGMVQNGFRAVIAPSFADIFYNNSFKNGLLPIALPPETVAELMKKADAGGYRLTVDLVKQTISDGNGRTIAFDINPHRKKVLLEGLDDIGQTLRHEADISAFETKHLPRPSVHAAATPAPAPKAAAAGIAR